MTTTPTMTDARRLPSLSVAELAGLIGATAPHPDSPAGLFLRAARDELVDQLIDLNESSTVDSINEAVVLNALYGVDAAGQCEIWAYLNSRSTTEFPYIVKARHLVDHVIDLVNVLVQGVHAGYYEMPK